MEQNMHRKFNDRQNAVRLFVMEFIINEGRPFNLEKDRGCVLEALSMSEQEFEECVGVLRAKDGMVVSDTNDVNFIYPVSALPTNHRVTLADGRSFTAMCAIDAMGAAFTFHQDTEVHSVSAVSGDPIFVKIVGGKVTDYSPKTLHALTFQADKVSDWAGSC